MKILRYAVFYPCILDLMYNILWSLQVGIERSKRRDRPIGIEEARPSSTVRRDIGVYFEGLILLQPRHNVAQESLLCLIGTSSLEVVNPDWLAASSSSRLGLERCWPGWVRRSPLAPVLARLRQGLLVLPVV